MNNKTKSKEEYVKKHKELVDKINSYEKEIFLS